MRVGLGYDVHQLVEGRPLILGGVTIPHTKGLMGHSDADVLTHAIMDALLGALSLGTIGDHFPDTDPAYKDANSMKLLAEICELITCKGYKIGNIDAVIAAQAPKLAPHMSAIETSLSNVLKCGLNDISVKATTTEKLGFEGREEGLSCQAIVVLLPL